MSISIGGVPLANQPTWIDRYDRALQPVTAYEGLDGTENIYEGQRGSHYPITFEITKDSGWMSGTEVAALIALAEVRGATYTLSGIGADKTVRFMHEKSGGAIRMTMIWPITQADGNTLYKGKIFLMCVG